jgi:hypothetical protein
MFIVTAIDTSPSSVGAQWERDPHYAPTELWKVNSRGFYKHFIPPGWSVDESSLKKVSVCSPKILEIRALTKTIELSFQRVVDDNGALRQDRTRIPL